MWKYLLLFLPLFFVHVATAQTLDTTQINIELALTGSGQTGNFKRVQLINQLTADFDFGQQKWNFLTRHLYLYQRVFGNKTQDDYLGRHFLTYRISRRTDVFAATFFEKYFIKRIDWHTQVGVGVRHALWQSARGKLTVGLMGSFSNKKYGAANFVDFENDNSATIRGWFITPVMQTQVAIIPQRLFFNLLLWLQQDVTESANWRYDLESALLVPLWRGLNLKISCNNFYENINLENVAANDWLVTYGLTYKFQR